MQRPLRIFYAAGPGDVVGTYGHWKNATDDPSQVAITYSGQFYDLCRDIGAEAYIVSSCDRPDALTEGPFRILHRRLRFNESNALLYHLEQLWSGLRMTASAVWYRADVALVMGGASWYSLSLLPL